MHRAEEDRLYKQFQEQRDREQTKVINGIQEEWEIELEKLTSKFERELSKKKTKEDYKNLTIKHTQEKKEFEKKHDHQEGEEQATRFKKTAGARKVRTCAHFIRASQISVLNFANSMSFFADLGSI